MQGTVPLLTGMAWAAPRREWQKEPFPIGGREATHVGSSMGDTDGMRRRGSQDIPFEHFRVFTFGSDEELEATFGSLEEAARAWRATRDEFMERWDLWGRPEAWWRFEPGIPDRLRSGPPAIITDADAAEWHRIDQQRRRYLLSIGVDPAPDRGFAPFGSD